MTIEQVDSLRLGIAPVDSKTIMIIESGIEWLNRNTTLDIDLNNDKELKALSASVKLFLIKFFDIQMLEIGVTSESIEGLSQSFSQEKKEDMIWDNAYTLLGDIVKSRVRFVTAQKKWTV